LYLSSITPQEILALSEDQLPKVTDKQLERVQAMEMREDR
jgi:hypothetical protein